MLHGLSRARCDTSVICSLGNLPSGADLGSWLRMYQFLFSYGMSGHRTDSGVSQTQVQSSAPPLILFVTVLVITDGSWATPRITQPSCVCLAPSLPSHHKGAFLSTEFLMGYTHTHSKLSSGENKQSQRCSWLDPSEQDAKSRAWTDALWWGFPGSV